MKYPKVLQILALATAITVAAPGAVIPVQATETMETPGDYEGRTGYVLPAGYHYVLNGQYIILDENDNPLLEADPAPAEPEEPPVPAEPVTPEMPDNPTVSEESGTPEKSETQTPSESEDTAVPEESEIAEKPETQTPSELEDTTVPEESEIVEKPETQTPSESEDPTVTEEPETPENNDTQASDEPEPPENPESVIKPSVPEIPEEPGISGGVEELGNETGNGDTSESSAEQEISEPEEITEESAAGEEQEETPDTEESEDAELAPGFEGIEEEPFYLTSAQFRALHDRIQYNVDVPIEGIPSFITQEMIVGALKAQDETGYPASVTIAQIIQESGYGKYGPGGEEGKGLSYLAFEYCNLFGIKGVGTAGSVSMKTSEMEADGSTYSTYAGFRSYHTYTECIEDRSRLLKEVYSDLTENVTDANTFAMKIGRRWATDLNYGKHLINTMRRYDLYRLDDMTLGEFSDLIGEFANPCPGSSITSLFGKRNAPIAGASTYHKGLDMGTGAYNIPTYAAKEGTVIFAGKAGACGNLITIDHGDGLVTKYMHHAEIYVKEGDKVEKGQQIGLSGTTGNSTGNHLHFQVEEDGNAVDPLKYLQAGAQTAEEAKKIYTAKVAEAVKETRESGILLVKEQVRGKLKY